MADIDYSAVSRLYRWVEYLVFGRRLENVRNWCLRYISSDQHRRVVLIGDGDGRFLQELLIKFPLLEVDVIEPSSAMVELARRRLGETVQVNWHIDSVEEFSGNGYDLVVGHFVLDLFSDSKRGLVVQKLQSMVRPGGCVVVSDFDQPQKFRSRCVMWLMQRFFYLAASHPVWRVEKDDTAFLHGGSELIHGKSWDNGWIYSQIWKNC